MKLWCFQTCVEIVCVCAAEDREGETDHGEEPAEPTEVENLSQCLCFMPEGLQRGQPAARAAPGVGQVHICRLPSVLLLSSHRPFPIPPWAATPPPCHVPGLSLGPWQVHGTWGGFVQLQQGHGHRGLSTLGRWKGHMWRLWTESIGSPNKNFPVHPVLFKDAFMDSVQKN